MRRAITFLTCFAFCAIAVTAAPTVHLNSGKMVNPAQCDKIGPPVINVTFKVVNDYDSAVHGNAWANDSFNRKLQVWKQKDGTFCAVANYQGQFVTFAGDSPNGSGTVGAGIKGNVDGGYIAVMNGTFSPTMPTNGNLGTFDFRCTGAYNCPGAFDWVSAYFTNSTLFNQTFWGWQYHTAKNGSWVNSSAGNEGDITGN